VSNILRLLELPDDVLDLIAGGTLSEGHGRAILQIDDVDGRRVLARRAAAAGLSVRQTEALARRTAATRTGRRPITQPWVDDEAAGEVIDAAYRAFGVTAKVTPVRGGCRIELVVRSGSELQAFAGRLGEVAELVETHILR
jgi:ParB family chromosome partitioning protein